MDSGSGAARVKHDAILEVEPVCGAEPAVIGSAQSGLGVWRGSEGGGLGGGVVVLQEQQVDQQKGHEEEDGDLWSLHHRSLCVESVKQTNKQTIAESRQKNLQLQSDSFSSDRLQKPVCPENLADVFFSLPLETVSFKQSKHDVHTYGIVLTNKL